MSPTPTDPARVLYTRVLYRCYFPPRLRASISWPPSRTAERSSRSSARSRGDAPGAEGDPLRDGSRAPTFLSKPLSQKRGQAQEGPILTPLEAYFTGQVAEERGGARSLVRCKSQSTVAFGSFGFASPSRQRSSFSRADRIPSMGCGQPRTAATWGESLKIQTRARDRSPRLLPSPQDPPRATTPIASLARVQCPREHLARLDQVRSARGQHAPCTPPATHLPRGNSRGLVADGRSSRMRWRGFPKPQAVAGLHRLRPRYSCRPANRRGRSRQNPCGEERSNVDTALPVDQPGVSAPRDEIGCAFRCPCKA